MDSSEFESVITGAREGAEWAWSAIYRDLAPQLLGYFRTRRARDPEDLVGEVFVQLARNVRRFEGDYASFRSWVFIVAHHRMSNRRRSLARKPAEPRADTVSMDRRRAPSAELDALTSINAERIMQIVGQLTTEQREVIALRVVADMSLEDTARVMGKSVGSVKQLQRRALIQLRSRLEEQAVTR